MKMNFDKQIKNILGKPKFKGKGDWDFDGIPDKKDCQPFNPLRQDEQNKSIIIKKGSPVKIYKEGYGWVAGKTNDEIVTNNFKVKYGIFNLKHKGEDISVDYPYVIVK